MSFGSPKQPPWRGGPPQPTAIADRGYWYGADRPLVWSTTIDQYYGPENLVGAVAARATYTTPLFNLRTDLDVGSAPDRGASTPIDAKTLHGLRYNLQVNIRSAPGQTNTDLPVGYIGAIRCSSIEFGMPAEPDKAWTNVAVGEVIAATPTRPVFMQDPVDITSSFQMGNSNALAAFSTELNWTPPTQLRYWGVCLVLDVMDPTAFSKTPKFIVSASLH
jgi:hypothetical protein